MIPFYSATLFTFIPFQSHAFQEQRTNTKRETTIARAALAD